MCMQYGSSINKLPCKKAKRTKVCHGFLVFFKLNIFNRKSLRVIYYHIQNILKRAIFQNNKNKTWGLDNVGELKL